MDWANQEIIKILGQDSVALAEATTLMSHVVSVEHIWLARICGQKETLGPWSKLTLPECREYSASNCAEYLRIISDLDEQRVHEPISFLLKNGKAMSSTLEDILCHVSIHGAHHRGQILRIISLTNIPTPAIDYLIYSMRNDG